MVSDIHVHVLYPKIWYDYFPPSHISMILQSIQTIFLHVIFFSRSVQINSFGFLSTFLSKNHAKGVRRGK